MDRKYKLNGKDMEAIQSECGSDTIGVQMENDGGRVRFGSDRRGEGAMTYGS